MRKAFRHSTLSILILSILLGSIGVAFSEQFCLMAGLRTSALAEENKDCCEEEPTPNATADECCAVKVLYEKLELVSSLKAFNLQLPVYLPHYVKLFVPQQTNFPVVERRLYTYSDSSPPVYGRDLLHQLHTLIV